MESDSTIKVDKRSITFRGRIPDHLRYLPAIQSVLNTERLSSNVKCATHASSRPVQIVCCYFRNQKLICFCFLTIFKFDEYSFNLGCVRENFVVYLLSMLDIGNSYFFIHNFTFFLEVKKSLYFTVVFQNFRIMLCFWFIRLKVEVNRKQIFFLMIRSL